MEIDLFEATVRLLEEGLTAAVGKIEDEKIHVATWKKGRYGAVLFVGPWGDDDWEGICAVTSKDADGRWQRPLYWGGTSWYNPHERQEHGWYGEPVAWHGGVNLEAPDGTLVRAMHGITAKSVAAIEIKRYSEEIEQIVPIDSPYGAVVVGVTDHDSYALTALDSEGRPVNRKDGTIALELLEAHDQGPLARGLGASTGAAVALSEGLNDEVYVAIGSVEGQERVPDAKVAQELDAHLRYWKEKQRRREAEKKRRGG